MKSGITTASLVLIPPIVGSIAYLAPLRGAPQYIVWSFLYIASGAIVWWPFSLFLKRRTFVAGLLGLHVMMVWFLYCMRMHWGDDLGWILYLPNLFVGLAVAIIISEIARKVQPMDAPNPAITPLFQSGINWRGVGDPGISATAFHMDCGGNRSATPLWLESWL